MTRPPHVAPDLAAACEALLVRLKHTHESAQDAVLEVRSDGRAQLGFIDHNRHWLQVRKFYREDDGTWVEMPAKAFGRNYSERPNGSNDPESPDGSVESRT